MRASKLPISPARHPPDNHVLPRTEPETAARRTRARFASSSSGPPLTAVKLLRVARQGRMQTERTPPVHDTAPARYEYHRTVFMTVHWRHLQGYRDTRLTAGRIPALNGVRFQKILTTAMEITLVERTRKTSLARVSIIGKAQSVNRFSLSLQSFSEGFRRSRR